MDKRFKTISGEFDLEAEVKQIGQDFLVAVWGGELPHIGAVSMAQSRPSLSDQETISSTASVFCYVGHKEDVLAKKMSVQISTIFKTKVVVTVGMHWDNLQEDNIRLIEQNFDDLTDEIINYLKK